jgi:hypothetical protein
MNDKRIFSLENSQLLMPSLQRFRSLQHFVFRLLIQLFVDFEHPRS